MASGTIRWSAFTEGVFHLGVLAQAAYLSGPGKQLMGVWVLVTIVVLPYAAFFNFRHGHASEETVARAHLFGALWYVALTMVCVALANSGYRPPAWADFLVVMAPGTVISLRLIVDRMRDPPSPSLPKE